MHSRIQFATSWLFREQWLFYIATTEQRSLPNVLQRILPFRFMQIREIFRSKMILANNCHSIYGSFAFCLSLSHWSSSLIQWQLPSLPFVNGSVLKKIVSDPKPRKLFNTKFQHTKILQHENFSIYGSNSFVFYCFVCPLYTPKIHLNDSKIMGKVMCVKKYCQDGLADSPVNALTAH